MTWAEFILTSCASISVAVVLGLILGERVARRRYGRQQCEFRCRHCGSRLGNGHTGYCPLSAMRGGQGEVVKQEDLPF